MIWIAEGRHPNVFVFAYDDEKSERAVVAMMGDGDQVANALLVSAAPDMLGALKVVTDTLIEWLPRLCGQREVEELSRAYLTEQIAMAQAAIAKAEGRT